MPLGIKVEHTRFFRYDAVWHWEIMQNGYTAAQHGNHLVSHYSIIWPLVMKIFSVVPGEAKINMMILNCAVFGLATAALARMALAAGFQWWKPAIFFCCFPTAFFANSVYNEPIFMLGTFMGMATLLEKKWLSSGLWSSLGVVIRINGWAMAATWIISVMSGAKIPRKSIFIGLAALGLAAIVQPMAIWHWRGSPIAHYNDLQSVGWMASPQIIPFKEPIETACTLIARPSLISATSSFMFHKGWSAISLGVCMLVLAVLWKKLPPPVKMQGLFTILGLGMLEQAISLPRYVMAFLPFYFLAARLPAWSLGMVCSVMAWSQLYLATRFVRGLWAF